MTQFPNAPYKDFDSFEELFSEARKRIDYSVEGAKNEFTEKIVERMRKLGLSKSDLADRLDAKRSFVTRLLSGNNNFTLETMVRIARALECNFRSHLEPAECRTHWVDLVRETISNEPSTPDRAAVGTFEEIRCKETTSQTINDESLPSVA